MRISTSNDFRKARRRRQGWVVAAGAIAGMLLLALLPEWLEVQWAVYPLPRVAEEIMQNLFWAFTTSTIFMLFENTVNGGGSLLERYRDIETSVQPLQPALFSTEFLTRPTDLDTAAHFDRDMRLASMEGWDGIKRFVRTWGEGLALDDYERTLERYREHADQWGRQMARNALYFSPQGLDEDFVESFRARCEGLISAVGDFQHRGFRNGPYWVLEEDLARNTILAFDEGVSEDAIYAAVEQHLVFDGAEKPMLLVSELPMEDDAARVFLFAPNTEELDWQFLYAPFGGDEEWATSEGSRELDSSASPSGAMTDRAFWRARPKLVLTPEILSELLQEAASLSILVDRYNEALEDDLRRARDYALAAA